MIIFFLNFISSTFLLGNWSDSTVKDEVYSFFEDLSPKDLPVVQQKLKNVNNNEEEILNSLKDCVKQPLLGLLNLSLGYRYYQPMASIKNPIKGYPKLRGWGLYEDDKKKRNDELFKQISEKVVGYINERKMSNYERIRLLKNMSYSMYNVAKMVSNSTAIINNSKNNNFGDDYSYYGLNGRSLETLGIETIDGIIDEYRIYKLMECDYNEFLNNPFYREPFHFTDYPPNLHKIESYNFKKIMSGWKDTPKMKDGSYNFCQTKQQVVKIVIFFTPNSPESLALLNWAYERAVIENAPLNIYLVLNVDLDDDYERRIAYAWEMINSDYNTREACLFFINGLKKNFRKAYKKAKPSIKWRKLKYSNMNEKIIDRLNKNAKYMKEHHINDVAVSINGEFIQERPIFPIIEKKAYSVVKRIKDANNVNLSNIEDWFKLNSIHIDHTTYLDIEYNNFLSYRNNDLDSIKTAVSKIVSHSDQKIPVTYFNCDGKQNYISEFTEKEMKFLRIDKENQYTIVGPLVFPKCLTNDEIDYCIKYIDYCFFTDTINNLSKDKFLIALIIRATMKIEGQKRKKAPCINFDSNLIQINNSSPLTLTVICSPFTESSREIFGEINYLSDSGAFNINIYPIFKHINSSMPHFYTNYHSSFRKNEIKGTGNIIIKRSRFLLVKNATFVSKIINYGFIDKKKIIEINGEYKSELAENGFFLSFLPIGSYKIYGTKESEYIVDSFIPCHKFYKASSQDIKIRNDSVINVLISNDNDLVNKIKLLQYSIMEKTNSNIKFWIVDSNNEIKIPGINIQTIPRYLPPFLNIFKQFNYKVNFKLSLIDLYLPPNSNVLWIDINSIFIDDISRFQRLKMGSAVVAAPIISSSKDQNNYWNQRKYVMNRLGRYYHTTSLIWFNMYNWIQSDAGMFYRKIFKLYHNSGIYSPNIDEETFNQLQLYVQFISLPEEVHFCDSRSSPDLAKKAVVIQLCTSLTSYYSGIKLEKMKEKAYNKY